MDKADRIDGMAKGLAVLESFDTERQRLNATLAAQRAGLSRASARRHLLTLADLGYLETDGSYYWLSPKVLRFAGSYLSSARLPRVLQPTLSRIAAQTRGAFSCVVLDGDAIAQVDETLRRVGRGGNAPLARGDFARDTDLHRRPFLHNGAPMSMAVHRRREDALARRRERVLLLRIGDSVDGAARGGDGG